MSGTTFKPFSLLVVKALYTRLQPVLGDRTLVQPTDYQHTNAQFNATV
jgi:hypothetical protein